MSQNLNKGTSIGQEDIEAVGVLVKEIVKAIRTNTVNCDRTYQSVVKRITKKGYVVLDEAGQERTVQCGIPNVELRAGQRVWVKEPLGEIRHLYICGMIEKK